MQYKTDNFHARKIIPEVGQCWRHYGVGNVYMRIGENGGLRIEGTGDYYFVSVCLRDGLIYQTPLDCDNIEILEEEGLTFRPKKGN